MDYQLMKTYREDVQAEQDRRIYTNPPLGQPFKVSQIEGMSLFTLALTLAQETLRKEQR